MAHQLNADLEEILSPDELKGLQARLSDSSFGEATTVTDIAEAVGLDVQTVQNHLRQLRAETAFKAPRTIYRSPLPYFALAALALAITVTAWRNHQIDNPLAIVTKPSSPLQRVNTQHSYTVNNGNVNVLRGIDIYAVGSEQHFKAPYDYGIPHTPIPEYQAIRDTMVASCLDLIQLLENDVPRSESDLLLMNNNGGFFHAKPGHIRIDISGWLGAGGAFIPVSDPEAKQKAVENLVDQVLAPRHN